MKRTFILNESQFEHIVKGLINERTVIVNQDTIPLDYTTKVDLPAITVNFQNYWNAQKTGPDKVKAKIRPIFKNLFGLEISTFSFYDKENLIDVWFKSQSNAYNAHYFEKWEPKLFNNKFVTIEKNSQLYPIELPTRWSLEISFKKPLSKLSYKSLSGDHMRATFEKEIYDYDKSYNYKITKDSSGTINFYTAKKDTENWIRLKPGTEPYKAVKSKVFNL